MEFGSTFVYDYSDSEEEWVSDDEFEDGMTYGEVAPRAAPVRESVGGSLLSSLASLPRRMRAKLPGSRAKKEKKHHWMSSDSAQACHDAVDSASAASRGKHWRRADTNIVEVSFDQLTAPSNMHTGDPVYCDECKAVLSVVSKVQRNGDEQVWVCEFCGHRNSVDLMEDEIPKNDVVTFMLQPAACTTYSGRTGRDESLVIFCVDISGSMCVTTEVPGSVKLRGDHTSTLQGLNTDHSRQRLPGERQDITYVSRLQGVQAAVNHQLGEMQRDYPDRRAAIVTFNSEVVVVGDGSGEPVHISGDKLSDKAELIKIGEKLALPKAVKETRTVLGDKIFDLEEGGQTALGPALLVAVAMACQVQGSKVIICTDGMANVGLGCLDTGDNDDDAYDNASGFYTEVGQMAVDKGVSVSVTSIKGTSCKLVELGQVAEATQGQVNIVDPLKLTEEFGSILANPVIATNVTATLLLHKHLYFRHEDSKESRIERKVGNVTKDTNITFEYGVRRQFRKPPSDGIQVKNPLYDIGEVQSGVEGRGDQMDASPMPDDGLTPPAPSTAAHTTDGATAGPDTVAQGDGVEASPPDTDSAGGQSASAASGASGGRKKQEDTLTELPFQLQIVYTDLDGAIALLVRSHSKPVTKDRHVAEKGMNVAAVGAHAAQMSSKLALKGNFTPSRMNAFMYQRLVRRHTFETGQEDMYECYYDNMAPIECYVNQRQQSERQLLGQRYSDDDDDSDSDDDYLDLARESPHQPPVLPQRNAEDKRTKLNLKLKKAAVSRRRECSDEGAQMLYSNINSSSHRFAKQ